MDDDATKKRTQERMRSMLAVLLAFSRDLSGVVLDHHFPVHAPFSAPSTHHHQLPEVACPQSSTHPLSDSFDRSTAETSEPIDDGETDGRTDERTNH